MNTTDYERDELTSWDVDPDNDNDITMDDDDDDVAIEMDDDCRLHAVAEQFRSTDPAIEGWLRRLPDLVDSYKDARAELEEFMSRAQDNLTPDQFADLVYVLKIDLPIRRFMLAAM